MKKMYRLKNLATAVTLAWVSLIASAGLAAKPSTAAVQFVSPLETEQGAYTPNSGSYQVAAIRTVCRVVDTNGGRLRIRQWPGGPIIGVIYNGTAIRVIVGSYERGYVAIRTGGYVYANYLRRCQ